MRPAALLLPLLLTLPAAAQNHDPAWLTPDQVRTVLRARGITDLGRLDREGNVYVVTDAIRYGERVAPLRLDALTGIPQEMPPLTPGQARALIEERGYAAAEPLGREGDVIRLRAQQAGTPVEVRVNARTGTVSR